MHPKNMQQIVHKLDVISGKDIRNSWYDRVYYDYPAMNGGIEQEQKYPHIKPIITIHRYKVLQQ